MGKGSKRRLYVYTTESSLKVKATQSYKVLNLDRNRMWCVGLLNLDGNRRYGIHLEFVMCVFDNSLGYFGFFILIAVIVNRFD